MSGKPHDPRSTIAVYALALVLGTAAGYKALALMRKAKPPPESGGFGAPALSAPDAKGVPRVRPPSAPPGSSEFEELMALVRQVEDQPAAKAFAEEFRKEPVLDEMWDDFQKAAPQAPDDSVEGFARALTERAEFRALVSKFAQDPGFRQVALSFSEAPSLKKSFQAAIARLESRRRSKLGRLGSPRGGKAARFPSRPGGSAAQAKDGGVPAPAAGKGGPASGTATALAGAPGVKGESEAGENGTTPLAEIPGASGSSPLNPWASLCFRGDPRMPKRMCDVLKELIGNPYDVWQACLAGGVWADCVKACKTVPELRCSAPPSWFETCLDVHDPAKCRSLCRSQGRSDCREDEESSKKKALLGYRRREDGSLEPDPAERRIILDVFQLFKRHRDVKEVVRILARRYPDGEAFHNKRGDPLDENSVGQLLKRREYDGARGFPRILPKGLFDEVEKIYSVPGGFYR